MWPRDYPAYFDEDIDISNCEHCPNADGKCFNAGKCLVEEYE